MPTEKRQRKREGQQARKAAALAAARRKQRKRRAITFVVLMALLALVLFLVSVVGGDDDDKAADGFVYGTGKCPPASRPAKTPESFDDAPKRCLEDDVDYRAVLDTSEGSFTIDLAEDTAPGTVNNFVALARWGWYDGDDFHRVVPGFVSQAGDPFAKDQGTGGPGYEIADELPDSVDDYTPGTVATANSGADTVGSQFFVCSDCSTLPGPNYTIFGKVVKGMDTVTKINDLGVSDGPPSKPITIRKVEITEK